MIKDEKENSTLLGIREKQRELREKQAENEEFIKEIEKLNTVCFAMSGSIKFEREKNESLKKEIGFRKKHLENIEKNFNCFNDKNNPESKFYVTEIKNKLIKEKLKELLIDRIPELSLNSKNENNKLDSDNEFRNLVIDHVNLIYVQSDISNPANDKTNKQCFRISSKSTFKSLKKIACQYWDIDNENDYVITDEAEGILYNEEMEVDSWLRDYSVLANNFKLLSIHALKVRNKLIGNQENRIKENNKFAYKGVKRENVNEMNMAHDNSTHKIREFFTEYQGLKPFTLISDEKGPDGSDKKLEGAQEQARNIETSFWMLLILILFFVLNLYFIYGTRDIGRNNLKINYVNYLFDNTNVKDYNSLYNYIILKLGFNFFQTSTYNETEINILDEENLFIADSFNSFNSQNINYTNWFIPINGTNDKTQFDNVKFYQYIEDNRKQSINFKLASSIHFISARVNTTDCSSNPIVKDILLNFPKCYEIYYDDTTWQTDFTFAKVEPSIYANNDNLAEFLKTYVKFSSSKDAGINLNVKILILIIYRSMIWQGLSTVQDIISIFQLIQNLMVLFSRFLPINPDFNQPTKSNTILPKNNIDSYFLVDRNVRSLMFLFTLYFPFENIWMSCLISFDFLPTGSILPGFMDFKMFSPNVYALTSFIVTDIIRMIIVIIFMVFMVFEFKDKIKDETPLKNIILSSKTFLNLFIFILFTISFIIKYAYCYNNEKDYFNPNGSTYKDTFSLSSNYNQIYYYESLLFFAVSMKILSFLRLNDQVKLFFSSIEMGISIFVKYCIFFIVILLGYACIGHILWGPYIDDFGTFGNSFLHILLFTIGYFNPNTLLAYNSEWTILFIGSFFLFVLFFMYAIFISIYAESLRRTVIKLGYPEDHSLSQWTLKDYMVWLCYCLGSNKKKEEENN